MQVTVARSRLKSLAALVGCVLFVALSLAILAEGTAITFLVGVAGVVTFGCFGVAWAALLVRGGPGLVVDETGFDDRSSAVAVGRVPWTDVTSVSEHSVLSTSYVVVEVRDPQAYARRLNPLSRLAARANGRLVGSPVTISSVGLKTSFSSLSTLISQGFERHRLGRTGT